MHRAADGWSVFTIKDSQSILGIFFIFRAFTWLIPTICTIKTIFTIFYLQVNVDKHQRDKFLHPYWQVRGAFSVLVFFLQNKIF